MTDNHEARNRVHRALNVPSSALKEIREMDAQIRQLEAERDAAYRRGIEDAADIVRLHTIQSGGALVPRSEGDLFGLAYATAIRALATKEQSNE